MGVDWNCWDGWELDGKVTHTILRGQVLVENGNLVGSPSSGRVRRAQALARADEIPLTVAPRAGRTAERSARGAERPVARARLNSLGPNLVERFRVNHQSAKDKGAAACGRSS